MSPSLELIPAILMQAHQAARLPGGAIPWSIFLMGMKSHSSNPRCLAWLSWLGWGAVALIGLPILSAAEWQSLLTNTPFGQPAVTVTAAAGEWEFRGVVQEEGLYLVNLYDPTTKTAQMDAREWERCRLRGKILRRGIATGAGSPG